VLRAVANSDRGCLAERAAQVLGVADEALRAPEAFDLLAADQVIDVAPAGVDLFVTHGACVPASSGFAQSARSRHVCARGTETSSVKPEAATASPLSRTLQLAHRERFAKSRHVRLSSFVE
jgi:hypothetical protein